MAQEDSYAAALQKMVERGSTPKAATASLKMVLERRGRTALLPRIARALRRLVEREYARNALTLTVSGVDQARAKKEAKEILAVMHVDADDVLIRTDENLIGGWRLEGREHLYDASFKKHLLELYKRVTSA